MQTQHSPRSLHCQLMRRKRLSHNGGTFRWADTLNVKLIDANHIDSIGKRQEGKVVSTVTIVVSKDWQSYDDNVQG